MNGDDRFDAPREPGRASQRVRVGLCELLLSETHRGRAAEFFMSFRLKNDGVPYLSLNSSVASDARA